MIDEKYGRLTVIEFSHSSGKPSYNKYWKCLCDCGNTKTVRGSHLKCNNVKSCGCISATTPERRKESKEKKDAKYRASPNGKKVRYYHTALRKARKKGAAGSFTPQHISWIREYQGDSCKFCKTDLEGGGQIDHKKPVSKGGSNWPSNLQLLCATCNNTKGAKWPYTFTCSS